MAIGAFNNTMGLVRRRLAAHPRALRTGVEIALGLALAVQTVRLVLIVVAPSTAPEIASRAAPAAADIGIFQRFDPFSRGQSDGASAATATGGYRLFGLRQGGPGGGSAIIGLHDGRQVSVGVGEEIEPGVILKSVGVEAVTLTRGGVDETLAFADIPVSAPVAVADDPVVAPPAPSAPPGAAETRLIDPARLAAQAALRPRLQGARVNGLTISGRGDGAALRAAGLQSGDVILAVNDTELNSLESLNALRGELGAAPTARIRFERNGQVQTVTVRTAP